MDNNKAATVFEAVINGPMPGASDLQGAAQVGLSIIQNGYNGDIAKAKADAQPDIDAAIAAGVKTAQDALQTEKDAHTADNQTKDGEIANLQGQIQTLTDTAAGEPDRTSAAVTAATAPLTAQIQAAITALQDTTSDPATVIANALTALGVSTAQPTDTSTPSDTITS